MFRSLRNKINNLIVIVARKANSSKKTFYELEKLAYKDSAAFIYENISNAILFTDINKFWSYCIKQIPGKGVLTEFGVFSGHSINYFSGELTNAKDNRVIFGFDSFEGLSENWGGSSMAQGHFNREGTLPTVNPNVKLIKGWIDKTLPGFVISEKLANEKIAFIHIDVDTYGVTKLILELCKDHLQEGTIIVFDELLGYPGWKDHEHKALKETLDNSWNYEFIAFCETRRKDYTSEYIRAGIRIKGRK